MERVEQVVRKSRNCIGSGKSWRQKLDETYDVVEGIRKSRSFGEISTSVLSFAGRFGAENLLAGFMPPPQALSRDQRAHVLLDQWPKDWSARYFSCGYLHRDPAIKLVRHGSAPFLWSEIRDLVEVDPTGRRIIAEAGDFRLREGLTISFGTLEGHMIGLSLAGERLELASGHRQVLHLVGACAFGQAVILGEESVRLPSLHLSARQRDVLRWAAEGLTIDEIAARLRISRNTVDSHLRAARLRLGVGTTIHAVAEGLRRGLLS